MVYTKRIFCCICPRPSLVAANSKSLLTTHIHSFLHSVSFYWASDKFQAPASTLETQKLKKTGSSQFGGLDSRVILMVTMAWKYSFKSKCKTWFLTVQKLRIQISQRTYFEVSPRHTPMPHLPPPHLPHPNVDTEDRPTSEAPRLSEADITSCYMALLFTVAPGEMGLPGHSILPAIWWCIWNACFWAV